MKKLFIILFTFFTLCDLAQAPVMNAITGPTAVCSDPSSPLSFTTSASNSPTSYSWTVIPSSGVTIFNPTSAITNISFPYSNGTYTLYCYATNGSGSSPTESFVVTVFETPTVTFSGANTFCQGSSTNLSASSTILAASPTIFYNWSPASSLNTPFGPNVTAFPTVPTIYTVTATKGFCSNTGTILITPLNNPTVTANITSTSFCAGNSVTLYGIGAQTYTWTNSIFNNVPFTPAVSNNYVVTGTAANGCTASAVSQVIVNQLPIINVSSSASVLCIGGAANISINGTGVSFSLNAAPVSIPFVISPTVTTTYTITASTSAGCTSSQAFTQVVASCNSIKELETEIFDLLVYPNPNNGSFIISSSATQQASVINSLGQVIKTIDLSSGETKVSGLAAGIYIIQANNQRIKIVVSN